MGQVIVSVFKKAVVFITFAVLFLPVITAIFEFAKNVFGILPTFAKPFVMFGVVVSFYKVLKGAFSDE